MGVVYAYKCQVLVANYTMVTFTCRFSSIGDNVTQYVVIDCKNSLYARHGLFKNPQTFLMTV